MLLQPKSTLAVGDIAALKLVSGDEIVGRITSLDTGSVKLSRPVIVQMQMVSPKEARLGFAPLMASADEMTDVTFDFTKLVFSPVKARKDVSDGYIAATSNILPAASLPTDLPNGFAQ